MQKTLFRKYLKMTTLILLVSFVFLGSIVTLFVTRYWNTERRDLLQHNAEGVANVAATSLLSEKNNTFTIDGARMQEFVSAFSNNIDAYIIVTDVDGRIVMEHQGVRLNRNAEAEAALAAEPPAESEAVSSAASAAEKTESEPSKAETAKPEQTPPEKTGSKKPESDRPAADTEIIYRPTLDPMVVRRVITSGSYYTTGTLNGYFDENCCIVGVPIVVTNESGVETTIGTTFAAGSTAMLSGYRAEIVKMFFLAALAAFMVAFGITWLFSYRMTRPLRFMVDATKSFAMGDFSVRVPVFSNDEVGELATAFNQMAETLANSENMNRNFIANVSHELKTPMTTISGFIDGIIDGTIPPEKERYYLNIVSKEVKRLSRLVKTMLDLSRIDSGKMTLHEGRFDISNTIFMALLSFESRIEEKRIEIRGLEDFDPLYVNGDPDMLHQVLYNLLENAVKFTEDGGYIEIHCTPAGGRVTVSVKNSGPGISPDDVKLIFDRFYKTDKSRSKDKTGMGLGLYIVKTMVQLHGGEIRCESVENEYTLFEFWIPHTERREKKSIKIIRKDRPGTVAVVDLPDRQELQQPETTGQREVLDVTEFAVEAIPEEKNEKRREGKRGR